MADAPHAFKSAETYLAASLNLSDVTAATARANLGVAPFTQYSVLRGDKGQITTTSVAGTYLSGGSIIASDATAGQNAFYLDPADFAVSGETHLYLLRAALMTNATALGTITFTPGLFPVTATAGGTANSSVTLGAATASATAIVNPAASTRFNVASADFAAPAAGYYAFGMVTSATIATNARVSFSWSLLSHNT